jgi:hypothetical protein
MRAEVVHHKILAIDVEHRQDQIPGLDFERVAGCHISCAAEINALRHDLPRNQLSNLLSNLLTWQSLTVRTRDVIKVGTLFRIEERAPGRKPLPSSVAKSYHIQVKLARRTRQP